MGAKLLCFFLTSAFVAYYIYAPVAKDFEEPWKVMFLSIGSSAIRNLAEAADLLGLMDFVDALALVTDADHVAAVSDENITVMDTELNGVAVRLYVPRQASAGLRRAVVFFHGGGWCLGHPGLRSYDHLTRLTANRLNAVVVSVNYRLAPKYHFPVQFEDAYSVTKFFLQRSILSQYGVDPDRVCVAGDSAGGNLAAAVAQHLLEDSEVETKLKAQALIYPALQALDLDLPSLPSYRETAHKPLLTRSFMVRLWSTYFTANPSLREAMASNRHVPVESSHLFQFVNWSNLLPEELKKDHVYTAPAYSSPELAQKYPGFLDVRAEPSFCFHFSASQLPLERRERGYGLQTQCSESIDKFSDNFENT
ncbi:PREDICTED: LOW QUALITY PROTEIN: arylacetamide deacetylase-like [Apaloderma vittatum]|uniref:LOW QUALITY PROTEIN: arylacetamide deacetylase-like n=1 Tax=Apaloderma vittatum TaxID=57397 RepID=UPI0005216942|nr:PREDICTED: LOW QUALITY PROTEIN: arylacetamide deacetylase-like [Apaloderma vittatum]